MPASDYFPIGQTKPKQFDAPGHQWPIKVGGVVLLGMAAFISFYPQADSQLSRWIAGGVVATIAMIVLAYTSFRRSHNAGEAWLRAAASIIGIVVLSVAFGFLATALIPIWDHLSDTPPAKR